MISVKEIVVKRIDHKSANLFICKYHYSGKVVQNSCLHFGAFVNEKLMGVLSFGHSINKTSVINLVEGTKWNEFFELNRMAFMDSLPKNSESRVIGICIRLIKKYCPHVKWLISFADGCNCGDGTIYRASNFKLIDIHINSAIRVNPANGNKLHRISAHNLKIPSHEFSKWEIIKGYQFKYIYLLKEGLKLNVEEIPFNKIKELGIGMYKGIPKIAELA